MAIKFFTVCIRISNTKVVSKIIYQHNILQTARELHKAIVMINGKQCRQIYEVETITEAISTRILNRSSSVF